MQKSLLFTTVLAASTLSAGVVSAQQQNQPGGANVIIRQIPAQQAQQAQGQQGQGNLPLSGQRLAQEAAAQQGTQIYVSPAGVRQVKQILNELGYDVGDVNATWDQNVQTAAANFQQAYGLAPTGQLTIDTLVALGQTGVLTGRDAAGLPGQRLAQEEAAQQGTPLYVSPAHVRLITQALSQAGYDPGPVDGQWGQQDQTAAANFLQAQGYEPTGQINVPLINALGLTQSFQQVPAGLPGQRLAQEQAQYQGTPLYASPAQVRQIKQLLNRYGYDVGNVNATWDQTVQNAVRNLQQAQGLEPSGQLTVATLNLLNQATNVDEFLAQLAQGAQQAAQGIQQQLGGQAGGQLGGQGQRQLLQEGVAQQGGQGQQQGGAAAATQLGGQQQQGAEEQVGETGQQGQGATQPQGQGQ